MSQQNPTPEECSIYASEFIKSGDMTKSFRKAFPKSKAKPKSINEKASVLHKHLKIQSRIAELQEITKTKHDEEFDLEVHELKKMLALAVKKGLKDKVDANGNKVAHNLSAAVSAVGELNRMNGNHAPVKNEQIGVVQTAVAAITATTSSKDAAKAYEKMIKG